ncbi:SWIM zinc finger domain-containing protein [Nocardioides sp. BP30]|uniref:SWIM zinc finger family protein n=1 Tax=Nocardioides sp. BP30 TaxID=3036374 RepID=UPI002469156E|nr:SWIM zinc finger domain-containing protein [Nocardioides sp. BP30]WGL52268.1 SWIM zinc finger domain-containing protein [Nocardioides sp. BP30]
MSRWSLGAVERLAPDDSSLAAARKLARPGPWSQTGSTDTLVWGRCQGSGRTPYQVSVDLTGPRYRCSCPSRKFPCKHALALLLLWVRTDGSVAEATETADFADAWARERAERAAARAGAPSTEVDPEARARRLAERRATMSAGIEDFARWLADLVRGGLAGARRRPWSWWDATAARLVDAQLPGLAEQLRTMAGQVSARSDWSEHLLVEAGRWWTAVQAWRRWDALDDDTRGDLRALLGWAQPREEVVARGTTDGPWQVLGAHRTDDGRLQQQRTWLRHLDSGETVQVLDFAAGRQPLPVARLDGSVLAAAVALYPGHGPRRGAFAADPLAVGQDATLPPGMTLEEAFGRLAAGWTANPWLQRVPVVLKATLVPASEQRSALVVDGAGRCVPMLADEPWDLLARTGGRPTSVFGELEASGFRPLTVVEVDR